MTHSEISSPLLASTDDVTACLATACLCHGRPPSPPEDNAPRSSSSPLASHVSLRVLRPILRQALGSASMQNENESLAHWNALDEQTRVPLQDVNTWLEDVADWLRDPALGLHALLQLERGTGDVVELAAECAPTLGDALSFFAKHMCVLSDTAQFHLHTHGDVAVLSMRSGVPVCRVLRDYQAGSLVLAMQSWIGETQGLSVRFRGREPLHANTYKTLLPGVPVTFHASCDALVFPAALLQTPMPRHAPKLHSLLARYAERTAAELSAGFSITGTVRRLLSELLPLGQASMEDVAKKLGLSSRTVARRLQQEGMDFSTVLNEVRRERALHYLDRTDLGPFAIAQLLGYANTSAFSRAFARWEGQSPIGYRHASRRAKPRPAAAPRASSGDGAWASARA